MSTQTSVGSESNSPGSASGSAVGADQTRRGPSLEELHRQLAEAVAKLETGDQWQAYLNFASRLHRYSFKNQILIRAQRPDATAVASYRTWQALDRQVRRGEHALRVIAPVTRRQKITGERTATTAPHSSVTAPTEERVVGFRAVPVFDISQTDGPPVPRQPGAQLLTGDAVAGLWDALAAEVGERGYRLLRGSLTDMHGANGVTKIIEREVWVRDDASPAQAAKTLAHELGHVLLHTNQVTTTAGGVEVDDGGMVAMRCAGIREVEAESVAHLVLAHHGIDTGSYTFPYVATWAHPIATAEQVPISDIITRVGNRVTRAAADLITATTPADTVEDPALQAIAARVADATANAAELHERADELRPADVVSQATTSDPTTLRRSLLGIVADSHDYFRRQLHPPADRSWIRPYLTSRGLDTAMDPYEIGYAPKSWTGLVDHLRTLGYSDARIEQSGIASRARNGTLIDRFRDRLTIPLHDRDGNLIAFTSRANPATAGQHNNDGALGPKYINSPASPLFSKREVLFGHRHNKSVPLAPVICEGPFDAIAVDLAANRAGLELYGVAAIGTAFTQRHAQLILDDAAWLPVHLAFDADPAGMKATENAWRQLTDRGPRDIRIVDLPAGTDPASLAVTEPDQLVVALCAARPAANVIAERRIDSANLDGNIMKEVTAFRVLSEYTNRMPIDQRPDFLLGLARRLGIEPAEAATMAAEHNPNVMLERITQHARQLTAAMIDNTDRPTSAAAEDDRYLLANTASASAKR